MPAKIKIFHETCYRYSTPVRLGRHKLLVRPRDGHDIRIEASRLEIEPAGIVSWHRDELDNSVALVTFSDAPTTALTITSEVEVTHYLSVRDTVPLLDHVTHFPFSYSTAEESLLRAYRQYADEDATFANWLGNTTAGKTHTLTLLQHVCAVIFNQFRYQERFEEGVQSPTETMQKGSGSCRDFAWLMVIAARHLGLAARFVSGYFHTAGTALADGSTHAWTEIYLPGAGWTGFDPTCNRMAAENHIPVSVAVSPLDIPPVSGLFIGESSGRTSMSVRVNVRPV